MNFHRFNSFLSFQLSHYQLLSPFIITSRQALIYLLRSIIPFTCVKGNIAKENVRTSHHASGTCKMGPASDPRAVVDQHGKVHGVQGLRVADASIMPNCPRANTNVTAMVIGERIGDLIRLGH